MNKEAMKLALEALEGIRRYGLDTLSGRVDGPDDREWQRACVNEMTKRARLGITALREALAEQPAQHEPCTKCKGIGYYDEGHECDDGSMAGGNYVECDKCKQPAQQEPVAQWQKKHPARTDGKWENTNEHDAKWWRDNAKSWEIRALYTSPPAQRKPWVGLTEAEKECIRNTWGLKTYKAIEETEAKLREKNT